MKRARQIAVKIVIIILLILYFAVSFGLSTPETPRAARTVDGR